VTIQISIDSIVSWLTLMSGKNIVINQAFHILMCNILIFRVFEPMIPYPAVNERMKNDICCNM